MARGSAGKDHRDGEEGDLGLNRGRPWIEKGDRVRVRVLMCAVETPPNEEESREKMKIVMTCEVSTWGSRLK